MEKQRAQNEVEKEREKCERWKRRRKRRGKAGDEGRNENLMIKKNLGKERERVMT